MKRLIAACAVIGLLFGCEKMQNKATPKRDIAAPPAMRIPPMPTIVTAVDCSPSETHAAKALQEHLETICGLRPEIRTDAEDVAGPKILVGNSRCVKQLAPDIQFESLGLEGFVIRTVDGNLILAGGRRRGTMYAVYDFLDRYFGCRWFATDCVKIPKHAALDIPPIQERVIPALEYREPFFTEAFDGPWSARNRMNSCSAHLGEDLGGKIKYVGFVHTFNSLVPPDKYFKDHPEYFSEINGKRVGDRTQLCLTNPDVVKIATATVREWIRKSPDVDIVSVSQNDWHNYCTCPKCAALAEKEESQSGPLIHFVNQVADNLKDEFPHVAIDTLAYQYTRKPPRFAKPRPNVIVRLCSIECCFSHPLATCSENKSFVDDIVGWSKICNRLYVWDYVTDFAHYMMPFPNLRVIQPNIKFFVAHSVKGIFEEGAYPPGGGAESAWLRSYLMAKCLWRPDSDPDAAMAEFLDAYYGPAAEPVRKYYDLIHNRVEKDNVHVRIYNAPGQVFTPELLTQCAAQVDEAEKRAAADPTLARRVRQLRMWLNYAQISLSSATFRRQGSRILLEQADGQERPYRQFADAAKEFGVKQIREGRPFDADEWLSSAPAQKSAYDIISLDTPTQTVEIIPGAGGRIYRWIDKSSGRNLFRAFESGPVAGLTEGGYEEYSESDYRSPGWCEEYQVAQRDEKSVRLEAILKNGIRIARAYRLDPTKPIVSISSTLSNTGKAARKTMLRSHPEFQLGKVEDCELRWRTAHGQWMTKSLAKAKEAKAEVEEYLRDDAKPAGDWLVWNSRLKAGIRSRFNPSQVGTAMLNWNYEKERFDLELWSPPASLAPGSSIAIEHSYEIIRDLP